MCFFFYKSALNLSNLQKQNNRPALYFRLWSKLCVSVGAWAVYTAYRVNLDNIESFVTCSVFQLLLLLFFTSRLESQGHEPPEVCWRESVAPPWAVEDHSSWSQNQGQRLQPAECLPRPQLRHSDAHREKTQQAIHSYTSLGGLL